ncbi:type II secretion system protein N (GspN) [Panacagrimonas perspica]|uniref:Type II secretion system protein N n=1 Tax=Panacagrimonas perspica TaxID=381431 RepID=A0A4S3K506_9GAMM|nr:type II secretion system protein N [Panacagrimonas perspica]TDU31583.1 type II secretion system protein N (GspN) [Panacagrimonas perspica]THD03187.1 hypothetical protein B1810_11480 [Panacagrimonas perspica]
MKRSSLIILGLLIFVGTLIFHTPAPRLYGWAANSLTASGIQLQGVEGTLSAGQATEISLQNRPLVRDLAWTLRKLPLLLGRASFTLSGGRDGQLIDGVASVVPSGTLTLSDFKLVTPLTEALSAAGYPYMPVEGQLGLDLGTLKLRKGWPEKAQGTLTLKALGWKLGREPVLLGDFEAVLDNETAGVKADIRSLTGTLEVTGEAHFGSDRSYEMNLQMRPKPNAPPMVGNLVRNLGQPDSQGWYHLRRQGSLAPAAAAPAPPAS